MGLETAVAASLIALQASASIASGFMNNVAYNKEADSLRQYGAIARQETEFESVQKQREIDKLAARQVMGMAKNSILTSEGSPLELLNETITLGGQEVNALKSRSIAQANYYNTLGKQSKNKGRAALIGGFAGASEAALTGYYNGATAKLWGPNKISKTTTVGSGL